MPKDEYFDSMVSVPCVQALVQLFNVIFWFAGLSIIWMAIWLRTEFDTYLAISMGYDSEVPPVVMLATGAIIIVVTSLACSCIVRVQSTLLIFYGGCLIVLLFSLVCVSIYVYSYKDDVTAGLESGLRQAIDTYDPSNKNGSLIDDIQSSLHCCGVETYLDWPTDSLPVSCCTTFPCDPKGGQNIYTEGCHLVLQHMIDSNLTTLGVILTAVAFFPLFGAISSFALASNVPTFGKHHYEVIP